MQREMDMIRKVLLAVQAKGDLVPRNLSIPEEDDFLVGYHVALLHEAGFIAGPAMSHNGVPYKDVLVTDLTWAGHDFVAALGNERIWSKIKSAFSTKDLAGMPLQMIQDIGVSLLAEWAKQKAGFVG
jgi:hypothetical protein